MFAAVHTKAQIQFRAKERIKDVSRRIVASRLCLENLSPNKRIEPQAQRYNRSMTFSQPLFHLL